MAEDSETINHFVTARHGHQELNHYGDDYAEGLLDGLFIFHNPDARQPLNPDYFTSFGLAQFYFRNGEMVVAIPRGYLLERTCISFVPSGN